MSTLMEHVLTFAGHHLIVRHPHPKHCALIPVQLDGTAPHGGLIELGHEPHQQARVRRVRVDLNIIAAHPYGYLLVGDTFTIDDVRVDVADGHSSAVTTRGSGERIVHIRQQG